MSIERRAEPLSNFLVLLLLALLSDSTLCDEFHSVKLYYYPSDSEEVTPRDPSVCSIWGKNLNHFARKNQPLSCARPIASENKALSRVNWKQLDLREHANVIRQLDRILFYDLSVPKRSFDEQLWRTALENAIREGSIELSFAEIDLPGAGYPERVIRYFSKHCQPVRGGSELNSRLNEYFVTDHDMTAFKRLIVAPGAAELFIFHRKVYAEWIDDLGNAWVYEFNQPDLNENSECYRRFLPEKCSDPQIVWAFVPACKYEFLRHF